MVPGRIDADGLAAWLEDGAELALVDVQEHGRYGEAHLLFASNVPYSRLERRAPILLPRQGVRIVLCDDGETGIALRAAARLAALGYRDISVLEGGIGAWAASGRTLFRGVNVPSKAFGELVEEARHTPQITADDLSASLEDGMDLVVVDGRMAREFTQMSIPGARFCPNGELALRFAELAPHPATTVVVNCAGRTRSIIGAQTLIDFGVPNRVVALENGTQGWTLSGRTLSRGEPAQLPAEPDAATLPRQRARARELAASAGAGPVSAGQLEAWSSDADRTLYVFDVRTDEEYAAGHLPGSRHAPGGQLVQAADEFMAVRGARCVLVDGEGVRAPLCARWLRQLGYAADYLDGEVMAEMRVATLSDVPKPAFAPLATMGPARLRDDLAAGRVRVLDIRSSAEFQVGHVEGSQWAIRPALAAGLGTWRGRVVLVADDPVIAAAYGVDLGELGIPEVRALEGGFDAWRAAGFAIASTPAEPRDSERLDFLFFVHDRHTGNSEASREYLRWERGLVPQLSAAERRVFSPTATGPDDRRPLVTAERSTG